LRTFADACFAAAFNEAAMVPGAIGNDRNVRANGIGKTDPDSLPVKLISK